MSLSSITLSGTIKDKAELRHTPSNVAVVGFTLLVTKYDSRAKEEKVYPVKVNAWGDTNAGLVDQLNAGERVLVAGRLQINQFTDKNGKNVRLAELEANSINFLKELGQAGATASSDPFVSSEPAPAESTSFDSEVPF